MTQFTVEYSGVSESEYTDELITTFQRHLNEISLRENDQSLLNSKIVALKKYNDIIYAEYQCYDGTMMLVS